MFVNKDSENKKLKNNILALASEAANKKKLDPSIINATSGVLKDENGILYEFDCVKKAIDSLSVSEKFSYASTEGTSSFNKAVLTSIFGRYLDDVKKECFLEVIPTPGGTGGLYLTFTNYLASNETVLLPNHMWENYLTMAKESNIKADTYRLFDDNGLFDIDDLNAKVQELKKSQDRIMILVNDPCENPTGFCMRDEDYDSLIAISKNNPDKQFIYLMDVAYFDFYNVNPDIIRKRFAKLRNIPNNALALFVFSGSKSFGLYGLRVGALICVSKDQKEATTFKSVASYSSRARWSSVSMLGISIIEKLVLNEEYTASYEEEVKYVCSMLEKRSEAFLKVAKEVGLKTLPYERGFFICVPCKDPELIMNALHEDKVHIVATHSCLRIALCGINKEEAAKLPAIIKCRLDALEK